MKFAGWEDYETYVTRRVGTRTGEFHHLGRGIFHDERAGGDCIIVGMPGWENIVKRYPDYAGCFSVTVRKAKFKMSPEQIHVWLDD